jgi:hypothetical protein
MIYGCKKENRFDLFKRTGKQIIEKRDLDFFNVIDVNDNLDVYLVQDSLCFAEIKAGKNLVSNIKTKVESNQLIINNNNKYNFTRSYQHKIEIYIHFKQLNELIYRGTGAISSINEIKNNSFTFNSWDGADTVKLLLDVPVVYANIHTGVADLIVHGKSNQLYAYARGSGTFRMYNFKCQNVYTNNLSSSDHYFYAEKKIEALVQYVGNTFCKGNPQEIVKSETNNGKLLIVNE